MTDELTSHTSEASAQLGNADDLPYKAFLARLRNRFLHNIEGGAQLYETDATGLFERWLDAFEPEERQFHNCNACRRFVEYFGHLVVIDEQGRTIPAIWESTDAHEPYQAAVVAMENLVGRAKILQPFFTLEKVWGHPETGPWVHMSITPPPELVTMDIRLYSPMQKAAEKREDYGTLARAFADFTPELLSMAMAMLKSDVLYRSEKVLGVAEWLLKVQQARAQANGKRARENITWGFVMKAPPGYCHPRSTMIGTLLEDLAEGMDADRVAKRFAAKMKPTQYQRPQAAPTAGNIAQAENVVARLGIAASLRRRFARFEELTLMWAPPPAAEAVPPKQGGVFAGLRAKNAPPVLGGLKLGATQAVTITWEKFRRTVLPEAQSILLLPPLVGNFTGYVTAVDPTAPPILQWDLGDDRNPVSFYMHVGGSRREHWNLNGGPVAVVGITRLPHQWRDEEAFPHQGKGVMFVLKGARSLGSPHLCLFQEDLRSELHGIRATIEAHSKAHKMEGKEEATACGLMLQQTTVVRGRQSGLGGNLEVTLIGGHRVTYTIDRWD
jgi:hypothetical protein